MLFRYALSLVALASLHAQTLPPCSIETVAGGGISLAGDGGPALEADILFTSDLDVGPDDSVYVADRDNGAVWRIFPNGHIETLPGAGTLESPRTLSVGSNGDVFVLEENLRRVIRISADGEITHFAGNGSDDFSGDGGPALLAGIGLPAGMDVGPDGSLYLATLRHQRVRRIGLDGVIETVAGSGPPTINDGHYTGDGMPATQARLDRPVDVAVASDGSFYIADWKNYRIRHVGTDGAISTVAGSGVRSSAFNGSDPLLGIGDVTRIDLGPDGLLYFKQGRIARIGPTGFVEVVTSQGGNTLALASDGRIFSDNLRTIWERRATTTERIAGSYPEGPFGEGQAAVDAPLLGLQDLTASDDGAVYVVERLFRLRAIGLDGRLTTVGESGGHATVVRQAPDGSIYLGGEFSGIRRYLPDGEVEVLSDFAGQCEFTCGEGLSIRHARFRRMRDLDIDSAGRIYIVHDVPFRSPPQQVRVVALDRTIRTPDLVYGVESSSVRAIEVDDNDDVVVLVSVAVNVRDQLWRWTTSDGSLELLFDTEGLFSGIRDFALGADGLVYLSESRVGGGRRAIWSLGAEGSLNLIAGDAEPVPKRSGDGGPAAAARFGVEPSGLSYSSDGHLYFQDGDRVRRINDVADCPRRTRPVIAPYGLSNAASYQGRLAPGQIFSLFGSEIGPADLSTAAVTDDRLTAELGGVQVFFDEIPAPLIFVSANQLSGVIPYGIKPTFRTNEAGEVVVDSQLTYRVERDGVRSPAGTIALTASGPGIFTADASGSGQAAALNEDGSLNSVENPAAAGSVVVLFATGEGETDPPGVDGKLAGLPLPRPVLPVRVTANGQEVELLYAGGAPGFTVGLMQVNVRLPEGLTGAVEIVLHVGEQASRGVTVAAAE